MNGGSHVQTGRRISQRTRSLPRTGNCAGSRRDCDQHRRDWLQHANGARSRRRSSDGIEFGSVGHPALPRLKCDRQNFATAVGGEHLRPARVPFRHPSSSGRWPGRWFSPTLGQRPISPQPIHALEAHLMEPMATATSHMLRCSRSPQPGDDLASLPSVFLFASMCLPSRLLQRDARENQVVLLVCHLQDMMSHILDRRSA